MSESPLGLEPIGNRLLWGRTIVQLPLAIDYLVDWPDAGLNSELGDGNSFFWGVSPSPLAGNEHVDKGGAISGNSLLCLGHQVAPSVRCCLGHIGNAVGRDYCSDVLPIFPFTRNRMSNR